MRLMLALAFFLWPCPVDFEKALVVALDDAAMQTMMLENIDKVAVGAFCSARIVVRPIYQLSIFQRCKR